MAAKRVVVDLFYDVVSPYSWVAFEMMCRYRHEWQSMALQFRPILLGALFKGSGNSAPLMVANKFQYMRRDVQRLNQYFKVPIVVPDNFIEVATKKTTLCAMRFVTAVDVLGKGQWTEELSRQLWIRVFTTHQDVTLAESLREAAKLANVDEDVVEKAIKSMEQNETKDLLRSRSEEALKYGAFGAPTTVVHLPDGPQMIFGCDRMEIIGSLLGEKYAGPLTKYCRFGNK